MSVPNEVSSPIISVVIPAYNAEHTLCEAIESILEQTFQHFEIIVIDDCSTDDTYSLMENYAKLDSRVRIYRNDKNLGIAGNRNKGLSIVCGKYLVWQDADDISYPKRLAVQLNFMEENPSVGIVGGDMDIFNGLSITAKRVYPRDDAGIRKCIFRFSPIAQPAAMIRMEVYKSVGNYDLKLPPAEDLDMTFRIGENHKLANVKETVIKYREIESSATFTNLKKMELSTIKIRKRYLWSVDYPSNISDKLYCLLHYCSVWIIPPRLKIKLFGYLRNSAPK